MLDVAEEGTVEIEINGNGEIWQEVHEFGDLSKGLCWVFFICSATISFGVTNPSDGNSLSLSLLLLLYSIMEFSLLFVCWENVGYVSRLACYVNF